MSKANTPNIFAYGTSELTQDAFIGWLCAWADPKYRGLEPELNSVAISLLDKFFSLCGKSLPEIKDLKVRTQWQRIDVFIELNDEFYLIIEDKIYSRNHSNQLKRYQSLIKEKKEVNDDKIIPIYFKTGDQCSYNKVREFGFREFLRRDFLDILKEGLKYGINNDIYKSYYEYLYEREVNVESYINSDVYEWHPMSPKWIGLHKVFKNKFQEGYWEPVNNPSRKFHAFWWNRQKVGNHEIYLQNEGGKFCFKVTKVPKSENEVRENVSPSIKRKYLKTVKEVGAEHGFPITKPARLGTGKWVTFAILNNEQYKEKNNWLPEGDDGKLSLDATLNLMDNMGGILNKTAELLNKELNNECSQAN